MSRSNEDRVAIFAKILEKEPWINPDWEPFAKCSEEEKDDLVFFCNMMGKFAPTSLGAIAVTFEYCNPNRQFLIGDQEKGHNLYFMDKLLRPEILET